jgi:predicted metalloprotease with PDZ domain
LRKTLLISLALLSTAAYAQVPPGEPQPLAFEQTIPAARDIDYPGTLRLEVDATDTARGIYRVRQTIPVTGPGPLVLLYPEWLPGNHAPRGPINTIAGLRISANGQPVQWRRDPADVYAFHVDVPQGATQLDIEFQHLSPTQSNQGRITMTPDMLNAQWEKMSLYPAGYYVRNIPIVATLTVPQGWSVATSLDVASKAGDTITYQPVSYETLVDSPVFAGRYFRREELSPDVNLNIFADRPEDLEAKPEQLAAHRRLVEQMMKLYRGKHYDEYEFLLALTDKLGGIGLEHLRSSENSHPRTYFTEWDKGSAGRDLLAHEMNHSWDGKYRRPADLFTPDYRMPMRNTLLWVYEGMTQFWGNVISARSGMMPAEDVRGELARAAAYYDLQPGRSWRPLVDTTHDPIINARRPQSNTSWQRSEDYYIEGMLIWLDIDSIIREQTRGRKSIDDFARAFFGLNPDQEGQLTYTFEDVVSGLDAIVPYDWTGYLNARVNQTGKAPLDWIERGGYRLAYSDEPTAYFASREKDRDIVDLTYTIGVTLGAGGVITGVAWDSPLFNEGVMSGATIVAVNGEAYSDDGLKGAIKAAKGKTDPIQLLVKEDDRYRTVALNYHDGLRYPVLEKVGKGRSSLDDLLAPLK